jgi:hypothetical protein
MRGVNWHLPGTSAHCNRDVKGSDPLTVKEGAVNTVQSCSHCQWGLDSQQRLAPLFCCFSPRQVASEWVDREVGGCGGYLLLKSDVAVGAKGHECFVLLSAIPRIVTHPRMADWLSS